MKIGREFEHLLELGEISVEEPCLDFKVTTNEITKEVVGFMRSKQVVNLPSGLAAECEVRERQAHII